MEHFQQVGALPVKKGPEGELLVLLVTTLRTQRWIIPKGWPCPGRPNHVAAAQEAREEAGVLGAPRADTIGFFTYEKRRAMGSVPVRVSVYLLEVQEELEDILRALVGMCYMHDQPGWQASVLRLVDVFVDGLRIRADEPPPKLTAKARSRPADARRRSTRRARRSSSL